VASRFYAAGAESAPKFFFDAQSAGTIFKADASSVYIGHYGAVRKLDLSNNSVTTVAGPAPSLLNTLLGGSHARFTLEGGVRKIGTSVYFGQTPYNGTSTTVLRKWNLDTNQIVTLGGKPDDPGHAPQIDGELATTARFNSINGIAQVGDVVYISDVCSIRKISGTSVSLVVGAYETTWRDSCGTTDGIGTASRLYTGRNYWGNRGVNLMASVGSSLYTLEPNSTCKIRKIDLTDPDQPVVTTLPGGGCGTPRDTLRDPGTATVTQTAVFGDVFPQLETDGTYLYFSEFNTYGHTIRRVDPVTGDITTIAGSPGIAGSTDGIGTAARFNYPSALAVDGGYLYIGDSNGVRRMNVTTLEVTTPFPGSSFPGLPVFAHSGRLYGQTNAALASLIWSADLASGAVSRVSERFSHNSGLVDGQAAVTLDNDNYQSDSYAFGVYSGGFLYAGTSGYSGQVLWKISPDGSRTAAGGIFNSLALVSGSPAEDTSLTYPAGVAIIGSTAYVVSSARHNLRAVNLQTGGLSLVAGTSGTSGSADGTGSGASFKNPTRITSDGTNLYVWDSGNRTIRKVVASSGVVTTILGDAASSTITSLTDGVGSAARFGTVSGLLWVGGKLYVSDSTHSVLREVTFAEDGTATITTIAGQGGTADVVDGTGTDARLYAPGIMTTDGAALYFVDRGKLRRYTIATGQLKTLFGSVDPRYQSLIGNGLLGVARPSGFPVYDPSTHSIYLLGTWGIRVLR